MKRLLSGCGLGLLLLAPFGCNKEPAATQKAPSAGDLFDSKVAASRSRPSRCSSKARPTAPGLMGEVRRAVDPVADGQSPIAKDPLPARFRTTRWSRSSAPTWARSRPATRSRRAPAPVGSGKAIVTLDIDKSGAVGNVKVDAPAFQESHLPQCVGTRAKSWTFPKFTTGPKNFSYPFVFVGG